MARKSQHSFAKRQKEIKRAQKAKEKKLSLHGNLILPNRSPDFMSIVQKILRGPISFSAKQTGTFLKIQKLKRGGLISIRLEYSTAPVRKLKVHTQRK